MTDDEMKFNNLDLCESEKFDKSNHCDHSDAFLKLFNPSIKQTLGATVQTRHETHS